MSRAARALLVSLLLALTLVQGYWSLTRRRRFSPDSMCYVNVAGNVLRGRGLAHDMLGFNQAELPTRLEFPEPFTVQGPLYPILIAAGSLTGVTAADAALLIPALAYPAILAAAFLLMLQLYDVRTALWALSLLVSSYPLRQMTSAAWADAPGLLLLLLSCVVLVRRRPEEMRWAGLLGAGLLSGLAFAERYPLLVSLPIGLALLFGRDGWRAFLKRGALFALGFALVAAPIVARNVVVTGHLGGGARAPAPATALANLVEAGHVLLGEYWDARRWAELQAAFFVLSCALALLRLPRPRLQALFRLWIAHRRLLLIVFPAVYVAFMVATRSLFYIDMDSRLLGPAHVFVLCLWASLLASAVPIPAAWLAGLASAAILYQCGTAWARLADAPAASPRKVVRESPSLRFLRGALRDQDLLVANNAPYVTFYLERPSVALMARPYAKPATWEEIATLRDQACRRGGDTYLLIEEGGIRSAEEWQSQYGPFVTDLMSGRLSRYPTLEELRRFPEGLLFRLPCGER